MAVFMPFWSASNVSVSTSATDNRLFRPPVYPQGVYPLAADAEMFSSRTNLDLSTNETLRGS